ncbi:hypothetical protein HanIR_Chr11g0543211 [Helianthus annuus]|nr:hypothetical protein HanIR_Chr11g0543211 [Helianthus annuus]
MSTRLLEKTTSFLSFHTHQHVVRTIALTNVFFFFASKPLESLWTYNKSEIEKVYMGGISKAIGIRYAKQPSTHSMR